MVSFSKKEGVALHDSVSTFPPRPSPPIVGRISHSMPSVEPDHLPETPAERVAIPSLPGEAICPPEYWPQLRVNN